MENSHRAGLQELANGAYAWLAPQGTWGWSNAGLIVERNQPGGDTSNNPLVEGLELNNIALLGLELDTAFAGLLRGVAAQKGHQIERCDIDNRDEEYVSALMLDRVAYTAAKRMNHAIEMEI